MKKYFVITIISLVILANGQELAELNNTDIKSSSSFKAETDSVKIPQIISYQGKLVDTIGRPVNDGSYVMVFSLYKGASGTYLFWRETQTITTNNGLFNVFLGSLNPIDSIASENCYLGIRVFPSQNEMTPRQKIVSVPFAYRADNSDKIQGKTIAGLDSLNNIRYVNVGELNSIDSAMVRDGAVTKSKLASNSVDSTKIINGSITSGDIKDSTITRADVVRGFKPDSAYFSDTAKYARNTPASDSARVAANAHRLQGKDTSALDVRYVNTGETGAITTGMIQTSAVDSTRIASYAVTTYHIKNGTIKREDVVSGFKVDSAYFSDTAKYARNTPASDSARVAGNAHKLQGKDTIALSNKFVDEDQDNAITTAMIVDSSVTTAKIQTSAVNNSKLSASAVTSDKIQDNSIQLIDLSFTPVLRPISPPVATTEIADDAINSSKIYDGTVTSSDIKDTTITRQDVALNFKAPYADTADYALYTPGVIDSARVSSNAHKLQGKDTIALSAKFIDEGQTASGDLAGTYPSPLIRGSVVNSAKIVDGSILTIDIADSAITSEKIQDSTITGADISPKFILLDTTLMGIAQIDSGYNQVTVFNTHVTNNSLIFLTIGPTLNSIDKSIKVKGIYPPNSFIVGTISNNSTSIKIPFQYVIIPRP